MFILQLAPNNESKDNSSLGESSSSSDDEDEAQGRRSRKKKRVDVDKVIKSVVRDRARDKVIGRQIKDLITGKDPSATSKQSFGYWISTLMPHINNRRFLQFAVDIMHHTIREVNASQLENEMEETRQRSASAPPPVVRSSPPSNNDLPLNLTTPHVKNQSRLSLRQMIQGHRHQVQILQQVHHHLHTLKHSLLVTRA